MSHRKKSWVKSGARFCASCAITLTCWAVWLVLGLTLVTLAYIAVSHELPVPGFVLRRIEAELAASGFDLQFGRARVDPTGKVLLEDVRLRSLQFDDPLLECRSLYLRHDFWSLVSARPAPVEIQVEGATLQLPAMLSASGTTEPIVRNLAARLHYDHHVWLVEQLACEVGGVRVTASGSLAPAAQRGPTGAFPLTELTGRYLTTARQLVPVLHQLESFDEPSLQLRLSPESAHLLLTAAAAHEPWGVPVVTGPLAAETTVRLDQPAAQPVLVHVTARRANYDDQVVAERFRAQIQASLATGQFTVKAARLEAAAGTIAVMGETLVGPQVSADISAWPAVRGRAQVLLDGEFLAVEADAQLAERRAQIHAEGRVAPGVISRVLGANTPRAAPYFAFGDPVWFQADATFAPGWSFAGVKARVDAGHIDSRGVKLTAARGRIDIQGADFLAYDAYAEIGRSYARGSYGMNFLSSDYRMLLDGRLQPEAISGWFRGDWWPAFWNRFFVFRGAPPRASVDVRGRWRDGSLSNNFVVARADNVSVLGGDFEHVDANVFVRPGFTHAWAIDGTRAGGRQRVAGSFKRTATPGVRDGSRFEFDFAGNLNLAVVGRMLEGRGDEVIAMLALTQPPDLHAWGVLDGSETNYRFTGRMPAPLHYLNFPFDQASVSGAVTGTDIKLDEINFQAAGGTGHMRATFGGAPGDRRLGFDLFVNDVKLNRVIHAFEEFDALRSGRPYVASPDGKFVRKAGNSQLDFSFSAQGTPGDVASFSGAGNAALTGAELGEVHLFGLLSQVLSGLTFSFSSLKLDAVRTSFHVENGAAYFPDLKVTGPSAVIDGRGKYAFATNALDFNAKFKPYDQPGSLLAAAVGLVMNPLTSILELRLTGPLGDPKWSVDVSGPSPSSKPNDQGRPPAPTKPKPPSPPSTR